MLLQAGREDREDDGGRRERERGAGKEVLGPLNAFDLCTEPWLKAPHDRQ